jgi:hypothetical protein
VTVGRLTRRQCTVLAALAVAVQPPVALAQNEDPPVEIFFDAASNDDDQAAAALDAIAAAWRDGYAALLVDLADLVERTRALNAGTFGSPRRLYRFLESQTGQDFGNDLEDWRRWVWTLPYEPHPDYADFKARLYGRLDPRFAVFFREPALATIRLDEIQWGGVGVNGIPPLENPLYMTAAEAEYLEDDNVVFGVYLDGQARAFPQRILAWHEMVLTDVGGRELAIVYCTLCGTVIPYDAEVGGRVLRFGTSGLLYRSNKLMFDAETGSLWSSLTGEPVVGQIVELGLRLDVHPVVTTTWGEWRTTHPDTEVLSIETGFTRDYAEGAAYRAYFADDELMFDVSLRDRRLLNKAEVLVLRPTPPAGRSTGAAVADPPPVAIPVDVLGEQPVFQFSTGQRAYVVLTSTSGANRVYAAGDRRFLRLTADSAVVDEQGREWAIAEDGLEADFDDAARLPRVSAHRTFWFAWYAQHPDTELIR